MEKLDLSRNGQMKQNFLVLPISRDIRTTSQGKVYTQTSEILVQKISVSFNCLHRISGIFDWMESTLYVSVFHRPLVKTCTCTREYSKLIDHFELQSAIFLTIIQCLLLGPVSPVHDLSKMRMILWQTSVKDGNLNSITFKKTSNVKMEATFHQEFIASHAHKVFPKYYSCYHVLFAQFCIKTIQICVMKGVYLVIVVWNDSTNKLFVSQLSSIGVDWSPVTTKSTRRVVELAPLRLLRESPYNQTTQQPISITANT